MRDRFSALLKWFGGLSAREQGLILIAIFAVVFQLADLVVFQRQYKQVESLHRAMARDNAVIVGLNTELSVLSAQAQQDPNTRTRNEIESARARVEALREQLASATGGMISPRDMARFLEQMLRQEGDLTMVSLHTLDVQPLVSAGDETTPDGDVIHRHGFEVTFSGGYLATLRYLNALEDLPWRFFWDGVSYEVTDYPRSLVRLQLYTLSMSEDWIGV